MSALLRVLAGVYTPDEGSLEQSDQVGSLLSVEAGLMPQLTGRENAVSLGVLAGLSRKQARGSLEEVVERCRLGDSFERPVSSYSQGMRARLGFGVIAAAKPPILLLDEVHEALDDDFRRGVVELATETRERGGAIVLAGHDRAVLATMAERAITLRGGTIVDDGPFDAVHDRYSAGGPGVVEHG